MLDTADYLIGVALFLRLLGAIYFVAFGAFLFQYKGLFGTKGILPIDLYLHHMRQYFKTPWRRFYQIPTVFWWWSSDLALLMVFISGVVLSILLMLNVYPIIVLPLLFALYLSVVSAGQDFLSFGWELFLLEITVNAFFLSLTSPANPLIWLSLNFLLFRFHFEAGVSKLETRDVNWRNLTALKFHYQTQPLPNTTAWHAYWLPMWFHKLSAAMMFFIEIIVVFAIFGPKEFRLVAFAGLAGLQLLIWLTGNFSYLNHLTMVLCVILLSDAYLAPFFGAATPPAPTNEAFNILVYIAAAGLLFLQVVALWNHLMPHATLKKFYFSVYPFHIANRYGIFAVMTTKRYEIVVEGSADGCEWKEYLFRYKPSELTRRPRRVSPYQPRLDWQAWFLPFSSFHSEPWFQNFLYRLLEGSPPTLALLRHNPFAEDPPRYIRALVYDYEFTDPEMRKKSGQWWTRRFVGAYSPTLSLSKAIQRKDARVKLKS